MVGSRSREGPPTNVHSRSRKCRTTWCPSAALRTSFTLHDGKSKYGARPLGIHQGGRVPDPSPQRGPPSATGARGRGATVSATDRNETPRSINILRWNAKGIYNKNIAFSERHYREDINVACLQETHLKDNQLVTMRGYQVFWHDREGRTKGELPSL